MNKNTQKYVLFSNGITLFDSDISEVKSKLSILYKMSESDIDSKLLNGKPTKIKSFDNQAKALRLEAKLTGLGLSCYISSPQSNDQKFELTSENGNSNKWQKWAIPCFVLFLIASSGFYLVSHYFTNKLLSTDLPSSVSDVESALFSSQKQSMLMHGNLQQLRTLLSVVDDSNLDEKSVTALSKVPLLEVFSDSKSLLTATDIVTAGASLNTKNQSWTTVLQGDYTSIDLNAELEKTYSIEPVDNGVLKLTLQPVGITDNGSDIECPIEEGSDASLTSLASVSVFALLNSTQIVFASSAQGIASFTKVFGRNEAVIDPKLVNWQEYRSGSLFAMSIFDEDILKRDFIGMAASGGLLGGESYDSLGIKTSVLPIKQALQLSFDANVNNDQVADKLAKNIQDGLDELQDEHENSFPAVIDLLSRISVESDDALHLTATLDKNTVTELENVVSDFFSMMFSGSVGSQRQAEGAPSVEQLDKYAWDFALNEKVFESTPLPVDNFTSFLPVAKNENVSIFMDSVGINAISAFDAELGEALQLSIEAKRAMPLGDAFFGWSSSGIKQSLSITGVFDNDGNELMVDERCVKARFNRDLNHQPSNSTNYSNGVVITQKTVRLIDVADATNIDTVNGRYDLTAPVDVMSESVSLNRPDVAWEGGSFTLSDINDGQVTYVLSDEDDRLLDVRGLNAKGQVLSMGSGMSAGKQFTKTFKGQVASLQLFIAGRFESQSFDFTIDSIIPTPVTKKATNSPLNTIGEPVLFNKRNEGIFSKVIPFSRTNDKDANSLKNKLSWRSVSLDASESNEIGRVSTKSSEIFFLHDEKSSWNHELKGVVMLPFDDALQFTDGLVSASLMLDGNDSRTSNVAISRSTVNGKATPEISLLDLDYSIGSFTVPFKEQRSKIKKIEGVLEYTLPTKIMMNSIDLVNRTDINSGGLVFKSYDFGWNGRVVYRLSDALAKAYFIKLTTIDGAESKGKIVVSKDIKTVEFETVAQAQKMDFYFIEDSHIVSENFIFEPVYK